MKKILLKLKLLEIKLKTSGSLGYLTYCIIGLAVMFVIWMNIKVKLRKNMNIIDFCEVVIN